MTLIAVLDSQVKNPQNKEAKEEQRKRWWIRRKKDHLKPENNKVQTAYHG
jgi:hypothetical protein